jgi:hypothetical protein
MKYAFPLLLCLLFNSLCLYSKDMIKWDDDSPELKIKASGRFEKIKDPKAHNSKNTPANSTAREMAVDHYRFKWQPKWNFTGLGGAILPFVLESSDESVLGIVETLPQKDAPFSSIIVFINLQNFDVINYTVMPGQDVRKFCFVPFSSQIICIIKSPYDKYYPEPKFQLQTIDTSTGKTISATAAAKEEPIAVCSNGKSVFAAFKDTNRLRVYSPDRLSAYTTLETVSNPKLIKCSRDGKKLLVAGSREIQFFDIEQQIVPEKKIALPEFFTPDKAILCSDDASSFLVSVFGGDTYFYGNGRFTKICKRTDSDVAWNTSGKFIFVGLPKDSIIAVYNADNLNSPETEFKFGKMRPATTAKLLKIVTLPAGKPGVAVLDKHGGLYYFTTKRSRWKKAVIIEEPKPL